MKDERKICILKGDKEGANKEYYKVLKMLDAYVDQEIDPAVK